MCETNLPAAPETDRNDTEGVLQPDSPKRDWSGLARSQSELIQPAADLVNNAVKIGAGLSTVPTAIGAVLLIAYLHQAGAELPPFDTSMAIFFLVLSAIFFVAISLVLMLLLGPFVHKRTHSKLLRELFPSLYVSRPLTSARGKFFISYAIFFAPLLGSVVCCFLLAALSEKSPALSERINSGIVFVVLAVLEGIFICLRRPRALTDAIHHDGMTAMSEFLLANATSLYWVLFLLLVPLATLERVWQNPHQILAWVICLALGLVILSLHLLLYAGNLGPKDAVAAGVVLLIVVSVYPGIAFCGGAMLRYLGAGGNLPILLTLKTSAPGARPIQGCLVIALNGQVAIHQGDPKDCQLVPRFAFEHPPESKEVDTYERSDVLSLSFLPKLKADHSK